MNKKSLPYIAVFLFCLLLSRQLWFQWYSVYDSYGWIFFFIWLLPLSFAKWEGCFSIAVAGLILCTLGDMGSLRFVQYIGLALSTVGLTSWRNYNVIWLIAALSWMPALGWLSTQLLPGYVTLFRGAFILLLLPTIQKRVWT